MELLPSSTPISTITMDTTRPETYSSRPCPKGCPRSGAWAESLKPSRVTTEEPASAVMAMDPVARPASSFPPNSSTFKAIPTQPHSTP